MINENWQHFPHEADMGIRGRGETPAQAFANAATAMTAVITDPALIRPIVAVNIECDAPDIELLFVDWLNALIFEMATRDMLFSRFEVTINDTRLTATAWGETVDRGRHQPTVEIKGATYTSLKVGQDDTGHWTAQCVVDV